MSPRNVPASLCWLLVSASTVAAQTPSERYYPRYPIWYDGNQPDHVVPGDVDGDGHCDVLFHWSDGRQCLNRYRPDWGIFEPPIRNPLPQSLVAGPSHVVAGDFNGDGRCDYFFHWNGDGANRLFLSNGSGFSVPWTDAIPRTAVNDLPDYVVAGDVNGDGRCDVLFHWKVSGQNRLYLSSGFGSFTEYLDPIPRTSINGSPSSMTAGDVDGDGRCDFLCHFGATGVNRIFLSQGTSFLEVTNRIPVLGINGSPDNVVAQDMNGDGRCDFLFHWRTNGTNRAYLSDGSAFIQVLNPMPPLGVNGNPDHLVALDATHDGLGDFLLTWSGPTAPRMFVANPVAGTISDFGTGTPGVTGVPGIGATAIPLRGRVVPITCDSARSGSLALLVLSGSLANAQLVPGVTLYPDLAGLLLATVTDSRGAASVPIEIPAQTMSGLPIYGQWLVADPAGTSVPALGVHLALTRGLKVVVE